MRVTSRVAIAIVIFIVNLPSTSEAIELSSFEAFLGTAVNFNTSLTVRQEGYPDIDMTAEYDTRPFEQPLYWAFRFGFNRRGRGAWELQFTHHKIYLSNRPDEIERLEITHGFNILTFARSFEHLPVALRVGAGLVIAHPDSIVRGQHWSEEDGLFDTGYHFTGPALLGGVGKDFKISRRLFVDLESQLIAAWAEVPVAEGDATAPNLAVHFLAGIGYRFRVP